MIYGAWSDLAILTVSLGYVIYRTSACAKLRAKPVGVVKLTKAPFNTLKYPF